MAKITDEEAWRSLRDHVAPLKKTRPRLNALSTGAQKTPLKSSPKTPAKAPPKKWVALSRDNASLKKTLPSTSAAPFSALDRTSKKRIAKGRITIDATLDLHGMREHAAHATVLAFIAACHARKLKTLLIITGKGKKDGEGVLRRNLANWLAADADIKKRIHSFSESAPAHGGTGAFYVLVRRKK